MKILSRINLVDWVYNFVTSARKICGDARYRRVKMRKFKPVITAMLYMFFFVLFVPAAISAQGENLGFEWIKQFGTDVWMRLG